MTDLEKRGYISEYTLLGAMYHMQYGIAKEDIDTTSVVYSNHMENIEILAVSI